MAASGGPVSGMIFVGLKKVDRRWRVAEATRTDANVSFVGRNSQ